jgi:hypothetical protein
MLATYFDHAIGCTTASPIRRLRSAVILGVLLMGGWAAGSVASAAAAPRHVSRHASEARRAAPRVHGHAVIHRAQRAPDQPDFGPNVYVFTPSMPQSEVQATVDAIASQQVSNQFGTQRYALLFEPGTYGSSSNPLRFQVGYYTEVAGLGSSPGDVTINGSIDVYNQCDQTNSCVALNNFWRSLSNLTINVTGGTGCQSATEFWAVSQAAPLRRVHINGLVSLMDYCNGGPDYASGGYIADSAFTGSTVINGSQQQFFVRNSNLDGWTNGVWNQVFSGDIGAPPQSFGVPNGPPYTTLPTSPVTEEKPYLQMDSAGAYSVFVPAVQRNSLGTSWQAGATPGTSIPIQKFFIASPATSVRAIDTALDRGKNLILTPGVYDLTRPIQVSRPNTVVLGLGFPTLVPQEGNSALSVRDVPGVKLSGMIVDAGPQRSHVLVQLGRSGDNRDVADDRAQDGQFGREPQADPTVVQDLFFRIGGATPGQAADSLVVNSSNVILDDVWAWRADHGNGVGWTTNTADHGLVVNGNDVTAYGLFVEHYQKSQVVWNGQNGEDIFFQSEMPYDVPSQAAWMASSTQNGYPSFQVGREVTSFTGYGLGTYSFFDQGIQIHASMAHQAPNAPGVRFHDLLTVFLNGSGGIDSVIDGTGAAVNSSNHGPSDVISYP